MHILFILDEFFPENSGGAVNVAFNLASGLARLGHEVLVLSSTFDSEKAGDLEFRGLKIKKILAKPLGKFRNWKNLNNEKILRQTEKVLEKFRPDIVHVHSCHHRFSYGVMHLAKKYAKGVFFTLHDAQTVYNGKLFPKRKICDLDPRYDYKKSWLDRLKKDGLSHNPFQKFFVKEALKKVDKIFAVSDALKEAIEANGIKGIEVMHNGINVEEWQVREAREKVILFFGRVDKAKGAEVLVEVFDEIQLQIPDAKLLIVGDKDFKRPENKNIEILPWLDWPSIRNVLSQSYLVTAPSLYLDPFPTVNLEAMAAAKPVVGTCFGGTLEVVADGETGYIVNPYEKKELVAKIVDLLENSDKATAFGRAGRKRAEELFSLGFQVQKTLSWYQKFLE